MTKEERAEWVRRGYKDPKQAYNRHAAGAAARGIEFRLTFAEWWGLWKDHYENRGRGSQEMVMCRTGDKGPYAVGNVRIATARENAQERTLEARIVNGPPGMGKRVQAPPMNDSWLWRRDVFAEYAEEEEGY